MKNIVLRRIFAFIIDVIIVSSLVSIISMVIPLSDNYEKLNNELLNVSNQYIKEDIDSKAYLSMVYNIEYDLKKETIPISIISIVVSLLYFAVLPFYNNGKTIGKMLNHIKIKSSDENELSMNSYVFRSLIINGIFISLCDLLLIFVIKSPKILVISSVVLSYMNLIIIFISLVMIIFTKKKQGIHGIISKTEVVEG